MSEDVLIGFIFSEPHLNVVHISVSAISTLLYSATLCIQECKYKCIHVSMCTLCINQTQSPAAVSQYVFTANTSACCHWKTMQLENSLQDWQWDHIQFDVAGATEIPVWYIRILNQTTLCTGSRLSPTSSKTSALTHVLKVCISFPRLCFAWRLRHATLNCLV